MPVELTLANKLTHLRGGRSLREVARAAGISASTLCRMEQGVHDRARSPAGPTLRGEALRRLARHFQVLPEYLTGDLRSYMRTWAQLTLASSQLASPGARLCLLVEELEVRYGIAGVDLARILEMDPSDLDSCCRGVILPDQRTLGILESVVGVPAAWVLDGLAADTRDERAYERTIALARSAGVSPEVLEDLLHQWLTKARPEN